MNYQEKRSIKKGISNIKKEYKTMGAFGGCLKVVQTQSNIRMRNPENLHQLVDLHINECFCLTAIQRLYYNYSMSSFMDGHKPVLIDRSDRRIIARP